MDDPHLNIDLKDMLGEQWMDVYGYDGIYQVSSLGRVKSLSRPVRCGNTYRTTRERILRQGWCSGPGIWIVTMCVDLERKSMAISRLVWEAFNGGPPAAGKVVMHRNKVKTDDRLENLEAVTVLESNLRNYETGVSVFAENLAAQNARQKAALDELLVASPTTRICRTCKRELPNAVFWRSDAVYLHRRCLDCRLKQRGVVDVGRQRTADELFKAGLRRCSPCGRIRPLSEFGLCKTCPGGHAHRCKQCVRGRQSGPRKQQNPTLAT